MRVAVWAAELADAFWKEAGGNASFPRDLRRAVPRAVQLGVYELPGLTIHAVRDCLRRGGIAIAIDVADRPLHGCLTTFHGAGTIFVNAHDSAEEQRFSIAHELAHYLRDYWRPRQRAVGRLGAEVVEVLDGCRALTPTERLQALLGEISVQPHVHFLARDPDGQPASRAIVDAEACADELAYELLAPVEHLAKSIPRTAAQLALCLRLEHGFPAAQAERYAALLLDAPPRMDPLWGLLKRTLTEDWEEPAYVR